MYQTYLISKELTIILNRFDKWKSLSNLLSNIVQKRKANATLILFNVIASFRIEEKRELNGPGCTWRKDVDKAVWEKERWRDKTIGRYWLGLRRKGGGGRELEKNGRDKSASSKRDRKKLSFSLPRATIHPRIINQFRGAVITVCFRAIAWMVFAGRGRKKIEQPVARNS